MPPAAPKTILIVDDEPANLKVLVELLKSDYHLLTAYSGENAMQIIRQHGVPELILLDIMMADMDGYEFIEKFYQIKANRNIPIIFVTALDEMQYEEKGLSLGAVDYISKPINPPIVKARINTHLELKRARDLLQKENFLLESEVAKRTEENLFIQEVTIDALAELAETRDSETGNHIIRTQFYVEALAKKMLANKLYPETLNEHFLNTVVKAAPLHDIGKVGIPDRILLKPGRLTSDEFEIMKTHSQIGGDTLSRAIKRAMHPHHNKSYSIFSNSLFFLRIAHHIALYHHERWDGTGYPEGLSDNDIPLAARIMSVADVYDAMIMHRVYKPAIKHEFVVEEMMASAGSQFDPEIMQCFAQVTQQFEQIKECYKD